MSMFKHGSARYGPAALALGVAGAIGASGGGTAGAGSDGLRCEVVVERQGSGVELEGLVFAKAPLSGFYTLQITKSGGGGSSDISQSGDFSADGRKPARLGSVALGGDGGRFEAILTVEADGVSAKCKKSGRL